MTVKAEALPASDSQWRAARGTLWQGAARWSLDPEMRSAVLQRGHVWPAPVAASYLGEGEFLVILVIAMARVLIWSGVAA
jgi:hypothetical protein